MGPRRKKNYQRVLACSLMLVGWTTQSLAAKSTRAQREAALDYANLNLEKPKGKLQKSADLDQDGRLSRYELALLLTHVRTGHLLVSDPEMRPFDRNQDFLLSPQEEAQWRQARKKPTATDRQRMKAAALQFKRDMTERRRRSK